MRGQFLAISFAGLWACSNSNSPGSPPNGSGGGIGIGDGSGSNASGGASTGTGSETGSPDPDGSGGMGLGGAGGGGAGGAAGAPGQGAAGMVGMGGSVGRDAAVEGGVTTGTGGSTPFNATYFIGTDISRVQTDAPGTLYTDSDGTQKDLLVLLKEHGFNYIRVRTFVDPRAADGNSKTAGFYDIPHTTVFGKRIKDAGMGFLLDFHYSDNWADPGKQCVPVAWQAFSNITQLAATLHDYTRDSIAALIAGGARPDMVQIGNEITPGMLIHRCDAGGLPTGTNPVTGIVSNWTNLGALLKAGAQAIRDIDPSIQIMIHLDRGGDLATSRTFITNAMAQGVPFDVFGESTYTLYQGQPAGWMNTFTSLATMFPNLKFVSAEYGPEERAINDILFNLPNRRGLGTFYWEATHTGADNAGHLLFSNRVAQPDLLLYDAMKTDYAGRL